MLTTFKILKTRWPEVFLIITLTALANLAVTQSMKDGKDPQSATFVPLAALLFVVFWLTAKLLSLGFVRTSFVDGPMRYEPFSLIKIGYHFFWRMIGLELVLGCFMSVIGIAIYFLVLATGFVHADANNPNMPLMLAGFYCGLCLMSKRWLLSPASILVTNCGVFDSLRHVSYLNLKQFKGLVVVFALWIGLSIALAKFANAKFADTYSFLIISAAVSAIMTLTMLVLAVRGVGEAYLAMQENQPEANPEPAQEEEA